MSPAFGSTLTYTQPLNTVPEQKYIISFFYTMNFSHRSLGLCSPRSGTTRRCLMSCVSRTPPRQASGTVTLPGEEPVAPFLQTAVVIEAESMRHVERRRRRRKESECRPSAIERPRALVGSQVQAASTVGHARPPPTGPRSLNGELRQDRPAIRIPTKHPIHPSPPSSPHQHPPPPLPPQSLLIQRLPNYTTFLP
jgi:hypothetical protein